MEPDNRTPESDYEGPNRREKQYVTVEGFHNGAGELLGDGLRKLKLGMYGIGISLAGIIFSFGIFYGQSQSTERELRAADVVLTEDHQSFGNGIQSISETMGSVVSEQKAQRRDIERLRDEEN